MFTENNISIYDFVRALSEAVDLVSAGLSKHHKRVAYISCILAQEANLSNDEMQDIILAAMLHDIGAFSMEERIDISTPDSYDSSTNQHALFGYKLLKGFAPLAKVATLIRHHHAHYDKARQDIPIGSYIIHLADRISVLLDDHSEILQQVPTICANIMQHQDMFHPDLLTAFTRLADLESFWVEVYSPPLTAILAKRVQFSKEIIDLKTLRKFAKVFAQLIDFRSRFTATHSSGVAAVAKELAVIDGFSERECKLMEIAGFLHDLGKLTVPNKILEKNGPLNNEELNCIRKHTYYTYAILRTINGLEHLATWAAYHHERLDERGYPFHVKGENFSKLARIMAVADIVTALTEDRPYRLGMGRKKAIKILLGMAENNKIDKRVVELVEANFSRINEVRVKAQQKALKGYEAFHADAPVVQRREKTFSRYAMPAVEHVNRQRAASAISVVSAATG